MAHLTAGDITPIGQIEESTYGTTPATPTFVYFEDVREGGNITPTDNPNPYLNWRYTADGKRTYDSNDYVNQQLDAGYNSAIECRDKSGWKDILRYAGISNSSTPLASIPSRSAQFGFKQDNGNTAYALTYLGCKTDQLKISADVPAGVVKFDETVLAAERSSTNTFTTDPALSVNPGAAVQWIGGVNLGGSTVYPQSFSITIKNNLGRVRAHSGSKSKTVALVEGRQEIEMELTLWMEDFTELLHNMDNDASSSTATLTLGSGYPVTLVATYQYMADGTNHGLVQDKQLQTVRLRVSDLYYN